jgi:hypothetical protein
MYSLTDSILTLLNKNISLFKADGPLWMIILTTFLVFILLYLLSQKIPPFKDAGDTKYAKVFALILSLIVVTSSPITMFMMWAVINVGGWVIVFLTLFILFSTAYTLFRKKHKSNLNDLREIRDDTGEEIKDAGKRTNLAKRNWKKLRRRNRKAKNALKNIKSSTKDINKDEKDADIAELKSRIDSVESYLSRNKKLILREKDIEENDPKVIRLRNENEETIKLLGAARDALEGKNKAGAIGYINDALKNIKYEDSLARKIYKEDRKEEKKLITEGKVVDAEFEVVDENIDDLAKQYKNGIKKIESIVRAYNKRTGLGSQIPKKDTPEYDEWITEYRHVDKLRKKLEKVGYSFN